jgi:cytochrome d ubiquinol oxidase subunit I
MFVVAISSYYLLSERFQAFSKRSIIVGSAFGLTAALCVVVLGDESGYTVSENQKMKLAVIEGMWETEPAPAGFNVFGIPDTQSREVKYAVKIPWMLGVIATRSFNQPIPGINDLVAHAEERIRNGLIAYGALEKIRQSRGDSQAREQLREHAADLGYALLLKRYVVDPRTADAAIIARAAGDTVPHVGPLFWSFRIMVALGFYFIALFAVAFWSVSHYNFSRRWLLRLMLWSLPLPWIAAELGWIVAEYGRQPWAIDGVLPTFLAVSSVSTAQVLFTLTGFALFYSSLLVVDIMLMLRYIRMGPVGALGLPEPAMRPAALPAE